jgi:hypothetical protein
MTCVYFNAADERDDTASGELAEDSLPLSLFSPFRMRSTFRPARCLHILRGAILYIGTNYKLVL